jgi:hypothetical protein
VNGNESDGDSVRDVKLAARLSEGVSKGFPIAIDLKVAA